MKKRLLEPSIPLAGGFSFFDQEVKDMDYLLASLCEGGDTTKGSMEDTSSKKVRKPYTITKSRESWTELEHDKFLEALQLYDRDWKKIEAFVGSKTVIQIRSHAQKYFLKVQKSGTNEHVPPPRPKKKAAHPYPQKAPKSTVLGSQVSDPLESIGYPESGCVHVADSQLVAISCAEDSREPWRFSSPHPLNGSPIFDAFLPMKHDLCNSSSNESSLRNSESCTVDVQSNLGRPMTAVPDFSKVYSFIGTIFDPNFGNHLEILKQMDPINTEAVLLLMKNLSLNLGNPKQQHDRNL